MAEKAYRNSQILKNPPILKVINSNRKPVFDSHHIIQLLRIGKNILNHQHDLENHVTSCYNYGSNQVLPVITTHLTLTPPTFSTSCEKSRREASALILVSAEMKGMAVNTIP